MIDDAVADDDARCYCALERRRRAPPSVTDTVEDVNSGS